MVLMTIDHADAPLNANRYWTNGAHFAGFGTGTPPEPLSFATRTITHLCAPTFLFLAGVSVVLSAASASRRGQRSWEIDRHLGLRGLILILLDPFVMTFAFGVWWGFGVNMMFVLQVLYAIGVGLVLSPVLRRLPTTALVLGAIGLVVLTEAMLPGRAMRVDFTVSPPVWPPETGELWAGLLFTGGWFFKVTGNVGLFIMYPCLPWLAPMMLGIAFGRVVRDRGSEHAWGVALVGGVVSLLAFAMIRGINGWGNTLMAREGDSLMAWLDVSKYPPGAAYLSLTLGAMGLILAWLLWLDARRGNADPVRDPISVLGKTALLYYLLHVPVLTGVGAIAMSLWGTAPTGGGPPTPAFGVGATWIVWPLCVLGLYPVCAWYGRYKREHRNVLTRYL